MNNDESPPGMLRRAARRVAARIRRRAAKNVRPGAELWNAQYAAGRWDYLGALPELSRYSVLVGYMVHFKAGGAVLDVGCGDGVLLRRMEPHGYSRYVGVDLSGTAIARLTERQDERRSFFVADGEHYAPTGDFDLIVFNEVIYFFGDPIGTVARYAASLRSGGVILVSICTAFDGGLAILERLKQAFLVLDETRLTRAGNSWSWICIALAPRSEAAAAAR